MKDRRGGDPSKLERSNARKHGSPMERNDMRILRLVHKHRKSPILQIDGSSITSNSYGFYSAAVVIFALAYLYIDGPAEKGRELPLELSFRGASLTNAGLSALCVSLQLALCLPAYCVELAHKSALKRNEKFHIAQSTLLLMRVLTAISSYGIGYWIGTKTPPVFFRGMLVLLGLSLQIKTLTFSYVNRDLRREYLRNKNIDKAGEITKRKAGRPPPGPVNKSGQVPEDDDSSNEWSQPYYKESELCPEMKQEMDKKQYPSNINLHDYLYFLVVPTLCYQTAYPRSATISIRNLIFHLIGMCFSYLLCIPILEGIATSELNLYCTSRSNPGLQRHISYAVIGAYSVVFIFVFFFGFLHSGYSFVAEITRFGDRHFYGEWWNSKTVSEYWRSWNLPVVNFNKSMLFPYLRYELHLQKEVAVFAIFTLSGIAHEMLFAPVTRCVKMVFFGLFMAQVPLVLITSKLQGWRILNQPTTLFGKLFLNVMFWIQYVICAIAFFASLCSLCWMKRFECAGNTLDSRHDKKVIGLVVGGYV